MQPELEQPQNNDLNEADVSLLLNELLSRFEHLQAAQFALEIDTSGSLPRQIDAPLIAMCSEKLGRQLSPGEKRFARGVARGRLTSA